MWSKNRCDVVADSGSGQSHLGGQGQSATNSTHHSYGDWTSDQSTAATEASDPSHPTLLVLRRHCSRAGGPTTQLTDQRGMATGPPGSPAVGFSPGTGTCR